MLTRRDAVAAAFLAAALALFFADTWLTGRTFFARDLTYLFHPMHTHTAQRLHAGEFPLWNPYVSGGVPWIGQPQTAVFSPGHLPFWVFSFVPALKGFYALHFFLSALGGFLLARSAKVSRGAAVAVALLWALNGFWRSRAEFPALLATIAWTPWAALFLRAPPRRRWAGPALAVTLALAVFAGHWPHAAWLGGVLMAVALARDGSGRFLRLGAAAAAAAVLAAAALFPGVDLMRASARAGGLDAVLAGQYPLSPSRWAGLLSPALSDFPAAKFTGERFFWLGSFYLGLTALLWAVPAFRRSTARARVVWAGLFALGASLAWGPGGPLWGAAVRALPGFGGLRYPAQFAYWMVVSVLALLSTTRLAAPRARAARWAVIGLVAAELAVWGARAQPTLPARYFGSRPGWISAVQGRPGKLFFSPRAVGAMTAEGATLEDTWTLLRHRLLDLGPLPYRVAALTPTGFSLNPALNERALGALYASTSAAAAEALFDRADVAFVAAPGEIAAPGLVLRSTAVWRVYERARPSGDGRVDSPEGAVDWTRTAVRSERVFWRGPSRLDATLQTRDLFHKSWSAWPAGAAIDGGGLWARVDWSGARDRVWLIFSPRSFRIGLLFSVVAWAAAAAGVFRRLRDAA